MERTEGFAKGRFERGYVFVELLVSMFFLSVLLLGLSQVFMLSIRSNSYSTTRTKGTIIAQDKLEDLKKLTYDGLVAGGSLDSNQEGYFEVPVPGEALFLRRWKISNDTPIAGMKTIQVSSVLSLPFASPNMGPTLLFRPA